MRVDRRITVFDEWYIPEPNSGCWLWLGVPNSDGYGGLKIKGRAYKAHRVAWERANGPIPDGMCVCHKCDVPSCVNPDHLFLGTHTDNMRDMTAKGRRRGPKVDGEYNPSAKLSRKDIIEIRSCNAPQMQVANAYGVSQALISAIITRKVWR